MSTKQIANICIQDLGAYNNGHLVFEWVVLPIDEDDLHEVIERVLSKGTKICNDQDNPHEEIHLPDYDSDYMDITEWSNRQSLNEIAEELDGLEDYELKKYAYLTTQVGYDHSGAISNIDNCDIYEDMTLRELAEQFVEEGLFGEIPEKIQSYLDYDAIARDLSFDYAVWNGDVYRAS